MPRRPKPASSSSNKVGSYGRSGIARIPTTSKASSTRSGYGVNNWWHTELEFETNRDPGPGNHLKFDQLTSRKTNSCSANPDEHWLD